MSYVGGKKETKKVGFGIQLAILKIGSSLVVFFCFGIK
jgi:hypothetical protein